MYEGKEVCQGCKKPGFESWRGSKNDLCRKCEEALKIGLARQHEDTMKYTLVRQHVHSWPDVDHNNPILQNVMIDLLKGLDNPTAEPNGGAMQIVSDKFGDRCMTFIIPTKTFQPLKKFSDELTKIIWEIREEKSSLHGLAVKAIKDEKDRIYNEGITKGRNLLFQLNNGELTIQDIEKHLPYDKR